MQSLNDINSNNNSNKNDFFPAYKKQRKNKFITTEEYERKNPKPSSSKMETDTTLTPYVTTVPVYNSYGIQDDDENTDPQGSTFLPLPLVDSRHSVTPTYIRMSCGEGKSDVQFEEDGFGVFTDQTTGKVSPVRRFTWKNANNVTVQVITYGATITSMRLPGKDGVIDDIVMGFDNMEGYLNKLNPYFGATVGRVANRVGYATITIDGVTYNVSANLGRHQLHGGFRGFDKVNWNHHVVGAKVVLSYLSADMEEGYPGDVLSNVSFELNNDNEFLVDFQATSTKPTFVNLTNHSYFNLAGHDKGAEEIYKHVVSINADDTTDVDKDSIPTGKLLPVSDTIFDLRIPKVLGDVIHKISGYDGYDHNFCINKASKQDGTFMARAFHPPSGRALEVYSNQPGVQFYCSNGIPEDPKNPKGGWYSVKSTPASLIGKNGCHYYKHGALCFETQNWPDAVNHKNFPKAVLNPGEMYHHSVVYKFFVN